MKAIPNLDKSFSVYHLLHGDYLQQASVSHRKTMSILSHAIEIMALESPQPVRVFSSFQSMSFFLPLVDFYRDLAARAEHVYVFGQIDTELPVIDNVSYIGLEPDALLYREWFIVASSPTTALALVTEDQTSPDTPHRLRTFKGILTYDRPLINQLQTALSDAVGTEPQRSVTGLINSQMQRQQMVKMLTHLQESARTYTYNALLARELYGIINRYIKPSLESLR